MANTPDSFIENYTSNSSFIDRYNEYQKRYAVNIRDSDRRLIELVSDELTRQEGDHARLLDVGCSTGNFLKHLLQAFPGMDLEGLDLAADSISAARKREELAGIMFHVGDASKLPFDGEFAVVTTNAVTYPFDYPVYEQILGSIYRALRPGGSFVAFEFFHDFIQDICILEKSRSHPTGINLYFRPMDRVRKILEAIGFRDIVFHPFEISVDLEPGITFAGNNQGFEDLNSYTVKDENGHRHLYRGALSQPWCHLVARK